MQQHGSYQTIGSEVPLELRRSAAENFLACLESQKNDVQRKTNNPNHVGHGKHKQYCESVGQDYTMKWWGDGCFASETEDDVVRELPQLKVAAPCRKLQGCGRHTATESAHALLTRENFLRLRRYLGRPSHCARSMSILKNALIMRRPELPTKSPVRCLIAVLFEGARKWAWHFRIQIRAGSESYGRPSQIRGYV